jgi:tRNA A37 threonylcarbamoyladenosine synthetase subunit TsaC/SUA5/YrdC
VEIIRGDGLIAYPTDSCVAFGFRLGNREAIARIRDIRKLDTGHRFTLVCGSSRSSAPGLARSN